MAPFQSLLTDKLSFHVQKPAAEPKIVEFGPEKRSVNISLHFSGTNSLKLSR